MKSPLQYKDLSIEALLEELCELTQDLVNGRRDQADLAAAINRDFFQVFFDAEEETVAARTKIAENATATLEQERLGVEANVACIRDQIFLIQTLLEHRAG